MAELWDAYDINFNMLTDISLVRGETIPDNVYHLVCDVIVKHIDGSYLLMMRDFCKDLGGMWELSAGGSALRGEAPIVCAKRELKEETGIDAQDIKEIRRDVNASHHSLHIIYLCVTDRNKNSVVMQEGETVDYRWVNRDTLLKTSGICSARALNLIKNLNIQ